MSLLRLAAVGSTWLAACAWIASCAADPGDASKALNQITIGPDAASGAEASTGAPDTGGGSFDSSVSPPGMDTGAPDSPVSSVPDSSTGGGFDTGAIDTGGGGMDVAALPDAVVAADTAPPPPVDAGPDCLKNIPSTCPNCMTMNASDMPACELYITCYMTNNCNPADTCGTDNDGVCGVNKVGGGSAPQMAAMATYACACP